ncbi:hypothetical protein [Mesorhizobium australicum]|uniref:hypothetical protein n=1 Tax=Mesorhizobium australicum TaxID=536018 RepID=UPI0015775633
MPLLASIGLDLAKHAFQVQAIDAAGSVLTTRALRRKDVLTVLRTLAVLPHWLGRVWLGPSLARELMKFGHDVRLMPPAYV